MKRAKTMEILNSIDYLYRSGQLDDTERKSLIAAFHTALYDKTKEQAFYSLIEEYLKTKENAESSGLHTLMNALA